MKGLRLQPYSYPYPYPYPYIKSEIFQEISRVRGGLDCLPIVLVGNKADLQVWFYNGEGKQYIGII